MKFDKEWQNSLSVFVLGVLASSSAANRAPQRILSWDTRRVDVSATDGILRRGDPVRRDVKNALLWSAASVVAFEAFAITTTQIPSVRAQSPWANDPYDAVVSFTIFFVPALATLVAARSLLCQRSQDLPVSRVGDVTKASEVLGVMVAVTALTDWVALLCGADHHSWGFRTGILVAALALLTVLVVMSTYRTRRVATRVSRTNNRLNESDWLSDLLPLASLFSESRPRVSRLVVALAQRIENFALGRFGVRRRPLLNLAVASVLASLVVLGIQAVRESGLNELFLVESAVAAGGFFAFGAIANFLLDFVHVVAPRSLTRQCVRVASTFAALSMPVSLAFRDEIFHRFAFAGEVKTPTQLAVIVATSCAGVFVVLLGEETVRRSVTSHQRFVSR